MSEKERKFSIGRRRDCDIVLADDSVSRVHAQLTFLKGGKLLLTDCKSTHGTFVIQNGEKKEVRQELISPLEKIQLGDVAVSVKEILESIRLKFPTFHSAPVMSPDEKPQQPKKEWVRGKLLERCECGHIKVKEENCPECGK